MQHQHPKCNNNWLRLMAALVTSMTLSACSMMNTQPDTVEPVQPVIYNVVKRNIYMPNRPQPVVPLELKFYVLTESNLSAQIARIKADTNTDNFSVIAMTPGTYENLSINTANTTRYIQDIQSILEYYERIVRELNTEPTITN